MLTLEQFKEARSVLQGVLRPTPLIHSPYLSKSCGNNSRTSGQTSIMRLSRLLISRTIACL